MKYSFTILLIIIGSLFVSGSITGQCEITSIGLSNVYCNDNATPADTLDDFIIFTIQPTGNGVSSFYNLSVSSGNLNSSTGQFGISKVFFLQPGSAGGGDILLTVTDVLDTNCMSDTLMIDPGVCSSLCEVTAINLTDFECNDNGSVTNPFDDFLSFKVKPEGVNVANMFFMEVSKGSVNPVFGNFGVQSSHIMQSGSAGNGDFYLSISDNVDNNCVLDTLISDPGSCSPDCEIISIHMDSVQCNNNGTPAIPEDDYIVFQLDPLGYNLSDQYLVSVSEGSIMPDTASYGMVTFFQLNTGSAGLNDITISLQDLNSPGCIQDTLLTNPGSCSPDCMIFDSGLTNVKCNDNNTDSTGVDDYITFDLNPQGSSNNGNFYIISVSPGNVVPSVGAFGQTSSFTMQFGSAGGGNVNITIKDMSDNTCQIMTVMTDPGMCSSLCDITDPQFDNLLCNDNGTDNDPTDDFLEFSLDPIGIELLSTYKVSIDTGTVSPEFAPYDTISYFSMFEGSAEFDSFLLHIEDSLVSNCFYDLSFNSPGSCSPECNILEAQLDSVHCNNNGTPSDISDDRIDFYMTPYGYNLNKNYTVIVSSGSITPTMGAFENEQLFSLQNGSAGAGDVVVKIKDIFDQTCPLDVLIEDPGTCSPDCDIYEVQLTDVQCNNNNTLSDYTDDYISFSLTALGFNVDNSYALQVSDGTVEPETGLFGSATDFVMQMGSAGGGDIILTIIDMSDSLCYTEVMLQDPGSCSPLCSITEFNLADLMCDDNATAHDTLDDFLSFSLSPEGFNIGEKYLIEISDGSIEPDTGFFGQTSVFVLSPGSAGSGDKVITLSDMDDPDCIAQLLLNDPGHCSDVCLITENNLTDISCNDNGTSSDASDDYIQFSLKPLGGNTAGSYYIFTDGGMVNPDLGMFGDEMTFALEEGTAGSGNQLVTLTDLVDSNCMYTFDLIDPGSCSPDCEIISIGLENVFCNDNGSVSDGSDDYISFQIHPSGFNTGDIYNIHVTGALVEPTTGMFDSLSTFSLQAGTAGSGDFEIEIISAVDSTCSLSITIEDPGTCSPVCEITNVTTGEVTCDDNGTMADNTDDILFFSLGLEGFNLNGLFTVTSSSGAISPDELVFSGMEEFFLEAGTAGAGDIEITISNKNEPTCNYTLIIPDPGTCSEVCQINNTNVINLHCEDNDTGNDPTDDYISFTLNPGGFNVSDSFRLSTLNWEVTPDAGKYGVPANYSLSSGSAGTGLNLLRIYDAVDTLCFKNVLLTNPGTCSEDCNILDAQLTNVICNDNETPLDSLDDYISFELNPSGYNLEGDYLLFAMGGIVVPTSGSYNTTTTFDLQSGSAGGGNVSILVIDALDNDCELLIEILDPGPCSDLSANQNLTELYSIKCFPNPCFGLVYLEGLPDASTIEIRNIYGELVYTEEATSEISKLELVDQSTGLYFLSVFNQGIQIFTEKLVKQ